MVSRIVVFFPLAAILVWGQVAANNGSVEGAVMDRAGLPIPDAKVRAVQTATGLERETETGSNGIYRILSLLPGAYELRIEVGSVSAIVRDVAVRVGSVTQLNISLARQSTPQSVDLSTSVLSLADSELTQVVPFEAIRDLPINGRRFQDFATLTPTVIATPETLGQLSFVGQRGVNSNVLIDGSDYNSPFVGGIRGGDRSGVAFTIPQSAIQEYQVVTSGYSAEYGRSTGGVLNAITRSGSNAHHGEAFYLGRHKSFSARNPYGVEALDNQHQFGGAVGGPIIANRLFFFGAVEQQFARFPREVRFNALNSIARTPDVAPAFDFFRSLEGPFRQTNDATAAMGRGDYRFGSHAVTGRYQWSRNNAENSAGIGVNAEPIVSRALSNNGREWNNIRTAGFQITSAFRPHLLNDFRAQSSFEHRRTVSNSATPFLDAGNIGRVGTSPLLPMRIRDRRLQFADAATLLWRGHALKAGFDYSYITFYQWYGDNQFGAFSISNSNPRRILQILSSSNRFDDPSVVYRRQVGALAVERDAHQPAFFVQDSWKVRPNLTFNFGLRWEGQLNPSATADNDFLVNNVRDFRFPLGGVEPGGIASNLNQWAPRLGVAWNPGNGRTVLRAQTGIFYGQTPFILFASPLDSFSNSPSDLSLEITPGQRGTVYRQFLNAGFDLGQTRLDQLRVFTIPEVWMNVAGQPNQFAKANVVATSGSNFRNPRALQFAFGVQHQVAAGVTLDYQLNYVNTVHLVRNVDLNVPRPFIRTGDFSERPFFGLRSGVSRPNPNLGQVLLRDSSARSQYTGQSVRLQWRNRRFEAAANYTLGFNRSDDDSERAISGITYQNPFDFRREYNWSSIDVRHMSAGYWLWRAPWQIDLTSLFRFRSGLPIDATTGADTSELLSGSLGSRPLERPGQPFLRNAFRNRSFGGVDLRALKAFALSESVRLQFSAEVFNVLNTENVAFLPSTLQPDNPAFRYGLGILPSGQLAPVNAGFLQMRSANGGYDAASTYQQGSTRQLQLGLRLLF